jgi:pseudaminic acid biosynthesis-associated methylase
MSDAFETEQEVFWAGEFGSDYIKRNNAARMVSAKTALFSKILANTQHVSTVFEIGSNIGLNLLAIKNLITACKCSAIEINPTAVAQLKTIPDVSVFEGSAFQFTPEQISKHDFTFTSGVLIHINPDKLQKVYTLLYECSSKYIMVNEYYSPSPVEVTYRGHSGRLFKRDFAGDLLLKYPDLELVDYGFQYHNDNNFPLDDCTWFLLKKTN